MKIPLNPMMHDIARFSGEEFPLWSFVEEQGDTALHGHRFVEVAFLIGGEVGIARRSDWSGCVGGMCW